MGKTNRGKRLAAGFVALVLFVSLGSGIFAQMGSLPLSGAATQRKNEPSFQAYAAQQIINWSPENDPYAEYLRSRIPLQKRIAPLQATQAQPVKDPATKMLTVMGDYGDAFMDNPPYTNKFALNIFTHWQYVDYMSYWHGAATAFENQRNAQSSQLWDATIDWSQRYFEIGFLNIPNPAWTDACHKNGVLSLGQPFFSNNDRGQITYKQMIVKDANGKFPVAEKMIEMARYYGFDGFFFNQEETSSPNLTSNTTTSSNIQTYDIGDYRAFLKTLRDAGLYINWYDSVNANGGANTFARVLNSTNSGWLYNTTTREQYVDSYFMDYSTAADTTSQGTLNTLNTAAGRNHLLKDIVFHGFEGGRDKFGSAQNSYVNARMNGDNARASIAILGSDMTHYALDEAVSHSDGGLAANAYRYDNRYFWGTVARERLWWTSPWMDPSYTTRPTATLAQATAVGADSRYWPGAAHFIAERSVVGSGNFYTNFNTGHGLGWWKDGVKVSHPTAGYAEWSNIAIQDILPSFQFWMTTGTNLTTNRTYSTTSPTPDIKVDFDYGTGYGLGTIPGRSSNIWNYTLVGGYNNSGSSLVANGTLSTDTFLRLYKTEIPVSAGSVFEMTYQKTSANDASSMELGVIFKNAPSTVVRIPLAGADGNRTTGWKTVSANLSAYAGREIALFGVIFRNNGASISNWQVNIGAMSVVDGTFTAPSAPTGLAIKESFNDTNELYLKWNLDHGFDEVKMYNIYVNNVWVGAKYDGAYYIKDMPAKSGVIKVVPVGADGKEGQAAELPFDMAAVGVTNVGYTHSKNGDFTVTWARGSATGDVTVQVQTHWELMGPAVDVTLTVPASAGSVTFADLPVWGDYFQIRISQPGKVPVTRSGEFLDLVCEPYAETGWNWNGNNLYLPMANTRDWRFMHVYEGGVPKTFSTTYSNGNRPYIVRGRSQKAALVFSSTNAVVTVVMEDYAGNKSDPVYLRNTTAVSATNFPDAAFRNWVTANVGSTLLPVLNFKGVVDLTGRGVTNLAGLEYFANATGLKLDNNAGITALANLPTNSKIKALSLAGTGIQTIRPAQLAGLKDLDTLDVSNMPALRSLDLRGLGLSHLVTGAAGGQPNLVYLDLRGTNIDMGAGTNERVFADYVDFVQTNRAAPSITYSVPTTNVASGMSATAIAAASTTLTNLTNGNNTDYTGVTTWGATYVQWRRNVYVMVKIDLGSVRTDLSSAQIYFQGSAYVFRDIRYEISMDNINFETIGMTTGNTGVSPTTALNGAAGRYLLVTVSNANASITSARICEIYLNQSYAGTFNSAVYYDGKEATDTSGLLAAIASAAAYTQSDYTVGSWGDLSSALAAANQALLFTNPGITKREVADNISAIESAIAALKPEKAGLAAAIAAFEGETETKWTIDSWVAAKEVYLAACDVFADDEATVAGVAEATSDLWDAIDALVRLVFDIGSQPTSVVLRKGMTYQLKIETNNPATVVYLSSNANATVNGTGLVTAAKTGSAVITVIDVYAQTYFTVTISITS